MSFWSDERAEGALKKLFDEGLSANEIAKKLNADYGAGVTRNAVIGKIHRLGWIAHSRTKAKSVPVAPTARRRASVPRVPGRIDARPQETAVEAVPEVECIDLTLKALEAAAGGCKWPIGNPGEEGFHYCGCKVARRSYCAEHVAVAYEPKAPSKPAQRGEARPAGEYQKRFSQRGRFGA